MQNDNFAVYQYKTVGVKAENQTRAADLYEAFGWEITSTSNAGLGCVSLSLKRDRKIKHKAELDKTERQAESVMKNIESLNRSKSAGANALACVLGILGALLLGGGMSLVMLIENSLPAMAGGIVLGLCGIAVCAVNYFIYKKIVAKKTQKLQPVIDEKEEQFANLLEKGNELLSADLI